MDFKRLLPTFLICIALFFGMRLLFPGAFGGAAGPTTFPPYALYQGAAAQPAHEQNAPIEQITLGSAEAASKDKLSLTVNNLTAGIDQVQLNVNDYAQDVKRAGLPLQPLMLLKSEEGLPKPFATLNVTLTDEKGAHAFDLYKAQYVWKPIVKTQYETQLIATLEIEAGKPAALITKTFTIHADSYEIEISHAVKNLTGQKLTVQIDQLAATDLPRDNIQVDDRFYHAAIYSTEKKIVDPEHGPNVTHLELQKAENGTKEFGQLSDYTVGKDPIVWIATSNRFFAAITRPLPLPVHDEVEISDGSGRKIPVVKHIKRADIDVLRHDEKNPANTVGAVRLSGEAVEIAANGETKMPLSVYMGPKQREILAGKITAERGTADFDFNVYKYISVIQLSSGGCWIYSFCTFDFLANFILGMLNWIVRFIPGHNYGIAIMILVIVVRAALHPLTRASQVNMAVMGKKMRSVQPELEKIKKRYSNDPKTLQAEQLRIYRENNVNPAGGILGCLPMFIQMPIWIALYNGLRTDIDLRHAAFIPGWINDLSNPDALVTFAPFTIPVIGMTIGSFNLLPILLGVVFFVQMKVQSASQPPPADPQQAQMQKMSQWMILLFPLFLYNAPSGLNLYMFASTMGGLVDTYFVRKTLRKKGILAPTAELLPTHDKIVDEAE